MDQQESPILSTFDEYKWLTNTRLGPLYKICTKTTQTAALVTLSCLQDDYLFRQVNAELDKYYQFAKDRFFLQLDKCLAYEKPDNKLGILLFFKQAIPLDIMLQKITLSPAEVVRMGIHLCSALRSCHINGFCHGGISPAEIFQSDDGRWVLSPPQLSDLITKQLLNNQQNTPYYENTAPLDDCESIEATSYADITALGRLLWQLLNDGEFPSDDIPRHATPELYRILQWATNSGENRCTSAGTLRRALITYEQVQLGISEPKHTPLVPVSAPAIVPVSVTESAPASVPKETPVLKASLPQQEEKSIQYPELAVYFSLFDTENSVYYPPTDHKRERITILSDKADTPQGKRNVFGMIAIFIAVALVLIGIAYAVSKLPSLSDEADSDIDMAMIIQQENVIQYNSHNM